MKSRPRDGWPSSRLDSLVTSPFARFQRDTEWLSFVLPPDLIDARKAVQEKRLSIKSIYVALGWTASRLRMALDGAEHKLGDRRKCIKAVLRAGTGQRRKPVTLGQALLMSPLAKRATVPVPVNPLVNFRHRKMRRHFKALEAMCHPAQIAALKMFMAKGLAERDIAKVTSLNPRTVHAVLTGKVECLPETVAAVVHAVRIAKPARSAYALPDLGPRVMALRQRVLKSGLNAAQLGKAIGCCKGTISRLLCGKHGYKYSPSYSKLQAFLDARDRKAANREQGTRNQKPNSTHSRNTRPAS